MMKTSSPDSPNPSTPNAHPGASADPDPELSQTLRQWVNTPISDQTRDRMRAALLAAAGAEAPAMPAALRNSVKPAAAAPPAVDLVPVSGTVWIRRAGGPSAVPCTSIQYLTSDTAVEVPAGSRAQVHYRDGSLLLLDGDTRLDVLPADAPRVSSTPGESHPAMAALQRGRLFAWIAPQSGGRFAIATPQGRVSVLGTEFDLSTPRDGSLQIVVAGGKVRFESTPAASSTASAGNLDFTLTPGQMLDVPKEAARGLHPSRPIAPRTLTPRELRRHVAWSGGADPAARSRRGQTGLKILAVVALLGLLGAAWFLNEGTPSHPASTRPAAAGNTVSASGAPAAVSPSSGIPAGGESVSTVEVQVPEKGSWVPLESMKSVLRRLKTTPQGDREVEVVLKDVITPPGANPAAAAPSDNVAQMVGKAVGFTVTAGGDITGIRLPKRDPASGPGAAIGYAEMIRHAWTTLLLESSEAAALQPGQTLVRKVTGTLSEYPGSSFTFASTLQFRGTQPDAQGQSRRQYSVTAGGIIGGLTLSDDSRNGRGVRMSISQYRTDETGQLAADPATGHVQAGELGARRSTTIARTMTAPGRPPYTTTLPPQVQERRLKIDSQVTK